MPTSRLNLADLLLVLFAAPIWWLVAYEVQLRNGKASDVRTFVFAIAILGCLTAALSRLVRPYPHAWPLSALLAGVGALGLLMWTAG